MFLSYLISKENSNNFFNKNIDRSIIFMDRKQETALITGASKGIGLEFTKILASMGYNLVIVSRSKNRLYEIKKISKTFIILTLHL